jgi:hypothetical protein
MAQISNERAGKVGPPWSLAWVVDSLWGGILCLQLIFLFLLLWVLPILKCTVVTKILLFPFVTALFAFSITGWMSSRKARGLSLEYSYFSYVNSAEPVDPHERAVWQWLRRNYLAWKAGILLSVIMLAAEVIAFHLRTT